MGHAIKYPEYQESGHRPVANLDLSPRHVAGMEAPDSFGQRDFNLKDLEPTGPLAELMIG